MTKKTISDVPLREGPLRVEVLCTGDELTSGLVRDANAAFLGERLFALGSKLTRASFVGDDPQDIEEALREATARCDVLIVSGGLGPTEDDRTVACVARVAGRDLEVHAPTLARIEARFAKRGLRLSPNNARQAQVPRGSQVFENPAGSAPMIRLEVGACEVYLLPGVPGELRALVDETLMPRLEPRLRERGLTARSVRILKTIGIPESHLEERLEPVRAQHPRVKIGFQALGIENHLRLVAEAPTEEETTSALANAEGAFREVLGAACYGLAPDELADVVGARMAARGDTVVTAESCTGGLVGRLLSAPTGAGAWLVGGAVTYRTPMKTWWADVDPELIERHGEVSYAVAAAMAEGVRYGAGATYGLSTTGYAGPGGGDDENPVGTVYLGLASPRGTFVERKLLGGDRERVQRDAAHLAMELLLRHLRLEPVGDSRASGEG